MSLQFVDREEWAWWFVCNPRQEDLEFEASLGYI
jgi:hypothetical protein